VLACVGKLIAFRQKRAREARRRKERAEALARPFLWIIAAGRPATVIVGLDLRQASGFPPGVYLGPEMLRVGLVVASELPRERSTVLVRLMAAGPLLPQAIRDLAALPGDACERTVAEPTLLNLCHALVQKPIRTVEE
jgi:hypothetical protein